MAAQESERAEPTFDKTAAEIFLTENYGVPKHIDEEKLKNWIKPLPDSMFEQPYYDGPIHPRDIRSFLKKRKVIPRRGRTA